MGSPQALVADLGGTHVRCALHRDGSLSEHCGARWSESAGLTATLGSCLAKGGAVSAACLAVAAPVDGPRVQLTNVGVSFDSEQLRRELGLQRLLVVNDVAALARSVEVLTPGDVLPLGGGTLRPDQTVAVVAPGTGLGVAAYLPHARGPVVVGGEGGHIPVPSTVFGQQVVSALLAEHGHVSAEDLVSGRGLPVLDVTVRRLHGERDPQPRSGPEITGSGDEPVLAVFVDVLAAVAQSHALTFASRGGVLLGGGFLRTITPVLESFGLRQRFVRHAKMAALLEEMPLVVDRREEALLLGAGLFLADTAAVAT